MFLDQRESYNPLAHANIQDRSLEKEALCLNWLKTDECKNTEEVKRSGGWTNSELGPFHRGQMYRASVGLG